MVVQGMRVDSSKKESSWLAFCPTRIILASSIVIFLMVSPHRTSPVSGPDRCGVKSKLNCQGWPGKSTGEHGYCTAGQTIDKAASWMGFFAAT